MALDLVTIPVDVRTHLIEVGRHFSSADTRAQAEQTLAAFGVYGADLARWGFNQADAERLQQACDALVAALVGALADAGKKVTSTAYVLAMRAGKSARLRARTILGGVRSALVVRGSAGETIEAIDGVLGKAPSAGASAGALARQLDALVEVLKMPAVTDAARDRGGLGVMEELENCSTSLHALGQEASARRTFKAAEKIDLLDGIIISLVRHARRAARAAARDLGEPELVTAFELTKLYGPLHKEVPHEDEGE